MKRQSNALFYYLGNKSKMTEAILGEVERHVEKGCRVADLFSGCGSVSLALAQRYSVTSVDNQEYSRVICSALVGAEDNAKDVTSFDRVIALTETVRRSMIEAYSPLLDLERVAVERLYTGDGAPLSDIIEHGCLLPEYQREAPTAILGAFINCNREDLSAYGINDAIVRYFGGTYFSYRQAIELSSIRNAIELSGVAGITKDCLLAALLSAASRSTSTVGGQFAQPLKTVGRDGSIKMATLHNAFTQRKTDVFQLFAEALGKITKISCRNSANTVLKDECVSFLESQKPNSFCAIYADPPYSRYHYSRYYHVLETVALGDEPEVSNNPATKLPSRGIYRADRFQSQFSTLRGAQSAFDSLLSAASVAAPVLVLSYSPFPQNKESTPRMVTIDQLAHLASHYYHDVEVKPVKGIKHSKLTNYDNILEAADDAEVLVICKR